LSAAGRLFDMGIAKKETLLSESTRTHQAVNTSKRVETVFARNYLNDGK